MRVYELARELEFESSEVLERALELGLEAKTAFIRHRRGWRRSDPPLVPRRGTRRAHS